MSEVQKIEDAIFQRVPFIFVKLGIVAGVAEVRLVEHRGVRRVVLGTGVDDAGVAIVIEPLVSSCFSAPG